MTEHDIVFVTSDAHMFRMFRKYLMNNAIPKKTRLVRPCDTIHAVTHDDTAIIADIGAELNGPLLIHTLRTLAPSAKIIALTSHKDGNIADGLRLSGASAILSKPINTGFLFALLERRQKRRRAAADNEDMRKNRVREYLCKFKVPMRSRGLVYIGAALEFLLANAERMGCMTLAGDVYPELERRYGVCAANAERDMRYVLEKYIRPRVGKKILRFGGKITPSSFIWTSAMKLSGEAAHRQAAESPARSAESVFPTLIL